MKKKLKKRFKKIIPYGRFFNWGWFWAHIVVFICKRWFRVTVTCVVWKYGDGDERLALVVTKLADRFRKSPYRFSDNPLTNIVWCREPETDLVKGGWRDEDEYRYELLTSAARRELDEEARIKSESIRKMKFRGFAFQRFNRHNKHRHGRWPLGKLLVVLTVQVADDTEWQQGSDPKIHAGEFTASPCEHFRNQSTKRKVLQALGWKKKKRA